MFVNEVLPVMFPEIQNFQETFSDPEIVGEYKMDSDRDGEGYTTFSCSLAVSPERYSQMEQDGWKEVEEEFKKAAISFGTSLYSNTDNPELPQIIFEITAY